MRLRKNRAESAKCGCPRARSAVVALTGLLGMLLTAGLTGCGADGEDGKGYIAYTWAVGPISFYTEDPAFAGQSTIYNGEFRESRPGTWYFEYLSWDDSYWYGTYEIYINEGESGGLFSSGDDGADLYFELACYSFGPSFYVWDSPDWVTSSTRSLVAATGAGAGEGLSASGVEAAGQAEIQAAEAAGVDAQRDDGAGALRLLPARESREVSVGAKTHIIEDERFTLILRYEKGEER
jgi:hypothetical protein